MDLKDAHGTRLDALGRTEIVDLGERRRAGPVSALVLEPTELVVETLVNQMGWKVTETAAGRAMLESALAAIDEHWPGTYTVDGLKRYAEISEQFANLEIPDDWSPGSDSLENDDETSLAYAVLGTVLFEPVILALRRLAHADRHRHLMDQATPEAGIDAKANV